jgi:hypothetical protein
VIQFLLPARLPPQPSWLINEYGFDGSSTFGWSEFRHERNDGDPEDPIKYHSVVARELDGLAQAFFPFLPRNSKRRIVPSLVVNRQVF